MVFFKKFTEKLDFNNVLIKPRQSNLNSRKDVDLVVNYTTLHSKKILSGIPIIASNMDTIGTFSMAYALSKDKLFTVIHKHYSLDKWKDFINLPEFDEINKYLFISSGTRKNDIEKLCQIISFSGGKIDKICLDNANGHINVFIENVKNIRKMFPHSIIMAGSVATKTGGLKLLEAGADIIRYGIGSGSVCTTRMITGVGVPQFSLILDCANAIQKKGGIFLSDGGITCPGDIGKAFGAGADFVMCGGLFNGHYECECEISPGGYIEYYGMASNNAMNKYNQQTNYISDEGKSVMVKYRGNVKETIQRILGGIRSLCTYTNSYKLLHLKKNVRFIKVCQQTNEIYSINKF